MPTHLERFQKGGAQAHLDWQAPHWPGYPEDECNPVEWKEKEGMKYTIRKGVGLDLDLPNITEL